MIKIYKLIFRLDPRYSNEKLRAKNYFSRQYHDEGIVMIVWNSNVASYQSP